MSGDTPATPLSVMLGGESHPIPALLTWPTLKTCRARILDLTRRLADALDEAGARAEDESELLWMTRRVRASDAVFAGLSDEDYDDLVVGVIYAALRQAEPALTREAFDAIPATEFERQRAWFAVRLHSGLFMSFDAPGGTQTGVKPEGEVAGAA